MTLTLLLFLTGGAAGLLAGSRVGGYALIAPALCCVVLAFGSALRSSQVRRSPAVGAYREPAQV